MGLGPPHLAFRATIVAATSRSERILSPSKDDSAHLAQTAFDKLRLTSEQSKARSLSLSKEHLLARPVQMRLPWTGIVYASWWGFAVAQIALG